MLIHPSHFSIHSWMRRGGQEGIHMFLCSSDAEFLWSRAVKSVSRSSQCHCSMFEIVANPKVSEGLPL